MRRWVFLLLCVQSGLVLAQDLIALKHGFDQGEILWFSERGLTIRDSLVGSSKLDLEKALKKRKKAKWNLAIGGTVSLGIIGTATVITGPGFDGHSDGYSLGALGYLSIPALTAVSLGGVNNLQTADNLVRAAERKNRRYFHEPLEYGSFALHEQRWLAAHDILPQTFQQFNFELQNKVELALDHHRRARRTGRWVGGMVLSGLVLSAIAVNADNYWGGAAMTGLMLIPPVVIGTFAMVHFNIQSNKIMKQMQIDTYGLY